MTKDKKRPTPPEPHVETDGDGPGNSIVQAAYSAALFNEQAEKRVVDETAEEAA